MRKLSMAAFVPAAILLSGAIAGPVFGQEAAATAKGPTAVAPYQVSVFATGIPGKLTAPDSIAQVHIYTVPGHNDGLKLDPCTGPCGRCRMKMPMRIW
ncbi:MAG: hypothetical protein WA744_21085 [Candidatus Acidiferrales bacterium]